MEECQRRIHNLIEELKKKANLPTNTVLKSLVRISCYKIVNVSLDLFSVLLLHALQFVFNIKFDYKRFL